MRRLLPCLVLAAALAPLAAPAAQPGGAVRRHAAISAEDCENLVRYQAQPGVAYQPGVDVDGHPVAPADLPGSPATLKVLPKVLTFDYTINPTAWAGQPRSKAEAAANSMMAVAKIRFDLESGRLFINGQPADGADEQAVAAACRKHGAR